MPKNRRNPSVALLALLATLLAVLLLVAGIYLGGHPNDLPDFARDALVGDDQNQIVSQAIDEIVHDYYRPVKRSQLVDSSVAGLVAGLHDEFSSYYTPSQYAEVTDASDSRVTGIGVEVRQVKRGLAVLQVFDNSPAGRAGVKVGDTLTAANGHALARLSEVASTSLIKGKPGTDVQLTLLRGGRALSLRVTRATVTVPVVASRLLTVHGVKVAQVALSMFSLGAHGQVLGAINKQLAAGAKGIVFDLRGNGGGLVEESRLVASVFVSQGTIVTTRGRAQPTETLTASGGAISTKIPVVVLVDHNSASAAEIVAGALQDHRRAIVVGTHTFGKGVFQELKPLSNGGALKLTVGEYFTPNGRNLGGGGIKEGAGITPNIVVRQSGRALAVALSTIAAQIARHG